MRTFYTTLDQKLSEVKECGPCGNRPRCEDSLRAIMESIPMQQMEDGELRPIPPRDSAALNLCMDAITRVAMCLAEKGVIHPNIPAAITLDGHPNCVTIE